ncbi:MAG: hypothetical protein QGH23_01810 [Dehalococcoidia bacterium]|jgi:hypothetical protein|nr:hypothetical protein [Dehalococcoidia bacterium]MDP6509931.1 hypothetical protein [Dehalococcoidia bacterium]
MGVTAGQSAGYIGHSLQTNIHYEPGESNLFREKINKGVKAAMHERDTRYDSKLFE